MRHKWESYYVWRSFDQGVRCSGEFFGQIAGCYRDIRSFLEKGKIGNLGHSDSVLNDDFVPLERFQDRPRGVT